MPCAIERDDRAPTVPGDQMITTKELAIMVEYPVTVLPRPQEMAALGGRDRGDGSGPRYGTPVRVLPREDA